MIEGMPVLVVNPADHEAEMIKALGVNPQWYLSEQPPEEGSPWRHHLKKRREYVESVLRRELDGRGGEPVEALLDLGCGDGNNLPWLAAYAREVYGSDYNAVRLVRARKRFSAACLFLADILDYPAPDSSFDIVFFNHVLEHIRDDDKALATVKRILRPGGLLIVGVPNEGEWWWQLAYRRAPDVLANTDHVHFYTARTVTEKIEKSGLEVSNVHYLGWGPPDWNLDGRLRQYKILDDLFEVAGKLFIPNQASSMYVLAKKAKGGNAR